MKKQDAVWTKDGFVLRLARETDAQAYYEQNYCPLDPEVARLTGCKESFFPEEVGAFFSRCLADDDCYLFLLIAPDGRIVGESVINEIDFSLRSANFRIALFHPTVRGRGIGTWAAQATRDFAFSVLKLHRLSLDVFSFNPRAERVYAKAGFQREGVLRDAVRDGNRYADDILMAMLEEDWKKCKELP